jgi:hypothetical protein
MAVDSSLGMPFTTSYTQLSSEDEIKSKKGVNGKKAELVNHLLVKDGKNLVLNKECPKLSHIKDISHIP